MSRARRDFLLLFLALVFGGLLVLAWPQAQANSEPVFNELKTVTNADLGIISSVQYDGANYVYVTPYGNYSFIQPLNILKFEDFQGNEVVDKSVFILQYKSGISWLPLLDFKRVRVTETTTYSYVLEYDVNYRDKGKNYNVSFVRLSFTIPRDPENLKPKINIEQNKTIYWDQFFKDSRWIWDIVPGNNFKYWKNATDLLDITQIQDIISLGNHTRIKFTDNSSPKLQSVLDVGDYGAIGFEAGKETYWNSKGFVGIFPINETEIDPIIYTELINSYITTGNSDNWIEINATSQGSIPFGAIVEIIGTNEQQGSEEFVGVRKIGSGLDRKLELHEAEGGGYVTARFLVQVNASGWIEVWEAYVGQDYYFTGYWEDVNFTERWDEIKTDAVNDNQWWEDYDLCAITGAFDGAVHMITLYSEEAGNNRLAGVRWAGSVLLRYVPIHESEAGGCNVYSMPVKTNSSNGNVDWYFELFSDTWAYVQGYFGDDMDFQELWTRKNVVVGNVWEPWDLSGDLDEDGRVTDFALFNSVVLKTNIGAREGGSILNRYIEEHESETNIYTGFGMSVKSNSTGYVELYVGGGGGVELFRLNGYYIPVIPYWGPTPPTLLFGAGFNHSIPFIELYWTQSVNHTDYEVQNSTDKLSWDFLAITVNNYYNDTAVSSSEYKYYRVRARKDLGGGVYDNTTFTDINLERVYFEKTGGGGPCPNVTGAWALYNFTSIETIIGDNVSVGGNWVNQTYWNDLYQYNVTEPLGAPGLNIIFNFSGLPDDLMCLTLVNNMSYDGSAGHDFYLQAWNFTSGAWVTFYDVPDQSHPCSWMNGTIGCQADNFIQGGELWGRYYHPSPGNINHLFMVDYGKLRAFSPIPCPTPTPTPAGFSYLSALAVILLLLGLMIGSRVRR